MAENTLRRKGELQRAVFRVLLEHPDGLPAKDVLKSVEKSLSLTDFEKSTYPKWPGVRRFEKLVRFSSIAPVKAGWLLKNRGAWSLTEEGRRALTKHKDPEKFMREAARLYREWADNQPEAPPDDPTEATDDTDSGSIYEEAEEDAWDELQSYMRKMPPYDFQHLVAALLRAMDYHVSWVAPPGRDGGIDIIAYTDPLGTRSPRIKVQVRRREGKVDVDGLRAFMAVLGEQDVGLFVSVGGFTGDAEREARAQEKRQITLLTLERLFDLWVEHYGDVSEPEKKLLPLKPVHFLAPPT